MATQRRHFRILVHCTVAFPRTALFPQSPLAPPVTKHTHFHPHSHSKPTKKSLKSQHHWVPNVHSTRSQSVGPCWRAYCCYSCCQNTAFDDEIWSRTESASGGKLLLVPLFGAWCHPIRITVRFIPRRRRRQCEYSHLALTPTRFVPEEFRAAGEENACGISFPPRVTLVAVYHKGQAKAFRILVWSTVK